MATLVDDDDVVAVAVAVLVEIARAAEEAPLDEAEAAAAVVEAAAAAAADADAAWEECLLACWVREGACWRKELKKEERKKGRCEGIAEFVSGVIRCWLW